MKPLRILIGAETYPPDVNGAARFAERLATGLAGRGHEIHVVAPSPTGPAVREVHDGVVVHGVRSHRYYQHEGFQVCMPWETFPAVTALMNDIDPDVVHTNAHMVVGRGVVRAAHRSGRPLVATNHLMPENLIGYSPIPKPLQRVFNTWAWRDLGRVFGKAAVVTAPTPRAVELLVRRAGLVDAFPVSCGIDADRYRSVPHRPGPEPTVLFVGRLDQEKRVDELIRAFAALPDGMPGRLEIVGDGARREEWTALADTLGVAHRVRLRGFVSEQELLEAYAGADLFCMPGIAELQSLVTLEAMAAGLPVVAADAMALPHLVRPGRNGWLYTPGDVPELTTRLAALLGDAATRRRMGAASRDIVSAHAIGATLDRFEGIYDQVLGREQLTARAA
ncbi:glycosyltransferase [Pseudonocardia sp. MH-G8]|uniref:glycosyltransferase n=1 Tax=Pseudonocardia sp. MH-G8 TaxID=1854588 RepID=UPI000BA0D1A5|nr:glycosyltransferase [Pseudonocardia sp. MH-G8]OZM76312.1 glycosyl transferase family 1 [Pseudonocardia sp. MH-G8]